MDPLTESRRGFMRQAASGLLGVRFCGTLVAAAGAGASCGAEIREGARAKRVIYLFMKGAMSHLDSFDPKPGTESQGETQPIATSIPGVSFGHMFPEMAKIASELAVVRSLSTETGAHEQGQYLMRTSYPQLNSIRHPGMGAWMLNGGIRGAEDLPNNVLIGSDNDHPMSGFLPPRFAPVPIADPALGLENIERPRYLSDRDFNARMELSERFDRRFRARYPGSNEVEAYNQMYRDAVRLMGSERLNAFDIGAEPEKVRAAYGDNPFGQGCLLARRLAEAGVPFIEVGFDGWDMHNDLYERLEEQGPQLDQGFAALMADLRQTGLLEETLVVLATEFGRTPKINENGGRDHHPGAFSGILAGAGIQTGQVLGASDALGFSVDSDGVSVAEFNATIAAAVGLSTDEKVIAPNGRPFTIANGASPVQGLLS